MTKTIYRETDTFDVKIGMPVRSASGEAIGSVVEVAGSGPGRVSDGLTEGENERESRPSRSTGYLRVMPTGRPAGSELLIFRFSAIESATEADGVFLREQAGAVGPGDRGSAHHSLEPRRSLMSRFRSNAIDTRKSRG